MATDARQSLSLLVQRWPVPTATAETYLVLRDSLAVRYLSHLRHSAEPALSVSRAIDNPLRPAAAAARGYRGVPTGRDYRGKPALTDIAPVTALNWSMIAHAGYREPKRQPRRPIWPRVPF